MFRLVLARLKDEGLLSGKTIGIDATTVEANAAMRSIVRHDTGEGYDAYLTTLAKAAGIAHLTREELARFDRTRKKKGSNQDWRSPADPDACIAKMKGDGRTHLAHKAEHAVDLTSGALVAVTVQPADRGDTTTVFVTLAAADDALVAVGVEPSKETVLDKGYHSGAVLVALAEEDHRSYVSEPKRKRRRWKGQEHDEEQRQLYANRRRHGPRNKRRQAKRAELNERSNAHLYETGGMRRVHLRGRDNILKRLLIQGAGFHLALIMRTRLGVGKPRGLQGASVAAAHLLRHLQTTVLGLYNTVKRLLCLSLGIPTVSPGLFHIPLRA